MMETLKPCPFCGGTDIEIGIDNILEEHQSDFWYICCISCGITIDLLNSKENAINKWNKRHEQTPPDQNPRE